MPPSNLTVAIPTYRRERVLIATIEALLPLLRPTDELLIVDQTAQHEAATDASLQQLQQDARFRWLRLAEPSITRAMNVALVEARGDVIVFLDDDIVPDAALLDAHRDAHTGDEPVLVAGRVIQPWQEGVDFAGDATFHFASLVPQWIAEFMGGNFSLARAVALEMGGFDRNFVRTAYRFEAEFAWRWRNAGRRIRYVPDAMIHHLKAQSGGTRTFGEHLTTVRPDHAVGEYYFALRTLGGYPRWRAIGKRLLQSIVTRHHLRRPWWIPVTLIAECRGLLWALQLHRGGPSLLSQEGRRIAPVESC